MKPTLATCAFLCLAFLAACRAAPLAAAAPSQEGAAGAAAGAAKFGVLAPLGGIELSLWPEAYSGSWLVLEVVPHGARVAAGDVIARIEPRTIDEEHHQAELALASSRLAHRATVEKNQLEAEAARSTLERAQAGLERSRRALASWKTDELAFSGRQDELSRRYQDANVEDQTDELDQLERMYAGDELVDATEDIVLKRSRRALELTRTQNALARDRARVHQELELALETERREEAFRAEAEALERLVRQQAIEARGRADAELRSADALAREEEKLARLARDRALFELRASAAGVLLHGSLRDYRPGKTPPRLARGDTLAVRGAVFVVAPTEPLGVAFDVADAERARYAAGRGLKVHALAGAAQTGTCVELDPHPRTLSTSEGTLEAQARLDAALSGAHYGERVRLEPRADER